MRRLEAQARNWLCFDFSRPGGEMCETAGYLELSRFFSALPDIRQGAGVEKC
jgi:hypothetical protein